MRTDFRARSAFLRQYAPLGVVFALLAAVGFSAKAIFVKLAYQDTVDSVTLLALRMLFSLPFFLGVAAWLHFRQSTPLTRSAADSGRTGVDTLSGGNASTHTVQPLTRHDWLLVLGLGFVGYYLSSLLDFMGLQYVSAGLERLILFLYPTLTVILFALVYRRPIGRRVIGALGLSYAGIALVFLHDMQVGAELNLVLGALLVFGSTLTYSVYLVGAAHAIERIGATRFTAYAMIVACAITWLHFCLTHEWEALVQPMRVYMLAIAMAVFSTVLPVFLLSWAIRRIGPGEAALIGAIGPVSTIFMAYWFLAEPITLLQIAGSALVLAGVLLISLKGKAAVR